MPQSTIAEREAELAALQSAFDEYITSSRELEEELDAELAKMRKSLLRSECVRFLRNVFLYSFLFIEYEITSTHLICVSL